MSRKETIVDILGLAIKNDTILADGILAGILEESKIVQESIVESKIGELTSNVLKTIEVKIGEVKTEELNSVAKEVYNLVDEVEVTSVNDTLS